MWYSKNKSKVTSTFVTKIVFVHQISFHSLKQLQGELYDYVHWFKEIRIHGKLGYIKPV
ncbi:IS3 family transposase [Paenibacillus yanchengensis]|uniref:IS3 family transposase n=1 Tax=Paenibacillus yanchengensis TaxID=2035833 RepID=A0ABW4YEZ0_9BACL